MWIIYALMAAVFYATASMTVKYSVSKVVRVQSGIVAVHALATYVLVLVLWLAFGRPALNNSHDEIISIISGILLGFAAVAYFKAFNMEDISVVTLLVQILVPMTMLAGVIFLNDRIGLLQLLASAVILGGVTVATWSRKGFHLHSTKIIPVVMIATGLTTAILIIAKSVVVNNNVIAYTYYQTVGYVLYGILFTALHPETRLGFLKNVRPFHKKMLLVILASEVFYTLALLSQLQAYKYVNPGLVASVGASEVFLSIMLGYTLTRFVPHLISEKIDRKTIGRKVVAGCMIVAGIIILNFVS